MLLLGEKHQTVASHTPPSGDLAHNPGVCPDWETEPGTFPPFWFAGQRPTHSATPVKAILFLY